MSKAGERILRSARQAIDYARGAREGYAVHAPERVHEELGSESIAVNQGRPKRN